MLDPTIQTGSIVERINVKDYTLGRKGRVLSLASTSNGTRAHVQWTEKPNGDAMNIKTHVRVQDLKLIA